MIEKSDVVKRLREVGELEVYERLGNRVIWTPEEFWRKTKRGWNIAVGFQAEILIVNLDREKKTAVVLDWETGEVYVMTEKDVEAAYREQLEKTSFIYLPTLAHYEPEDIEMLADEKEEMVEANVDVFDLIQDVKCTQILTEFGTFYVCKKHEHHVDIVGVINLKKLTEMAVTIRWHPRKKLRRD